MDNSLDDLFDDYEEVTSPEGRSIKPQRRSRSQSRRNPKSYRSALGESETDRRKVARATGKKSSVAGQYIRRSFTFRPDQIENIDYLAPALNLSKNDLVRWFMDMGVEAVESGVRPPIAEEIRHRYDPNS